MSSLCSEAELSALVQIMQNEETNPLPRIEALLELYPDDARLTFLLGSVLIGLGRHIEAHAALTRTIALAPDFDLARFQLGFFELTSGEANSALTTWALLDRLPPSHFLRKFVAGLRSLIRDDFEATVRLLREGIAANTENAPMNRDMQLIIDRCLPLLSDADAISETSLILGQFTNRGPGGLH